MSTTSAVSRRWILYAAIFIVAVLLTLVVAVLLLNINSRKQEAALYPFKVVEIQADELDPAVWGKNFPFHYDTFVRTQENYGETPYGGSEPYSKLERYPAMVRLWAGYAFSIDHNEERGHYYAQIDQAETERVKVVSQPGACADCHDPDTMELRISRPAFAKAMAARGIDLSQATRQEMRSYVCAQCHVEYYFQGDDKLLTFPWTEGLGIDEIEKYYDSYGFKDWIHAETGAPMLKMQHPEFELWSSGIHARSGVSCADCHMPYTRQGSIKVSDHWLRSPLTNVGTACQTCHKWPEEELKTRIVDSQNKTAELLRRSEEALIDAIDAMVAAKNAGATDDQLAEAQKLHRSASMRWDFISSENSTGFHSPQEAARVLAVSIDQARQAQLKAMEVLNELSAQRAVAGQ